MALLPFFGLVGAFTLHGAPGRTMSRHSPAVTMELSIRGAENSDEACYMLPGVDFQGESLPAAMIGASLQLEEREDASETLTEITLHADGTVEHKMTDGPLPENSCGLWQCGGGQFQMTLQRSFSVSPTTLPSSLQGKMQDDITYSVTRIFVGTLEDSMIINGKIALLSAVDQQLVGQKDAYEVLGGNPPIGYFALISTGPPPGQPPQ